MDEELLTELKNEYDSSWIKFLIISRGRHNTITSHKIFPFADIVVPESEKDLYAKYVKKDVFVYPDEICGLSVLRNWILDNYQNECVIMIDDDIIKCLNLEFNIYTKIENPEDIKRLLISTATITKDLNKSVFGYKASENITFYDPHKPFKLSSWVGTVIGIVGRKFRFDEHNILKTDADYCLQAILKDRIIIRDERYTFVSGKIDNAGGNSTYRTKKRVELEKLYLKNKWGKSINFNSVTRYKLKSQKEQFKINVKRTQ